MKFNLPKWLKIGGVIIALLIIAMIALKMYRMSVPPPSELSTPERIEWDYEYGNITEEQKILYLHYALNDRTKKLPPRYDSIAEWEGTSYGIELSRIVASYDVCRFSSFTQSELRRIYGDRMATCDDENNNLLVVVITVLSLLVGFAITSRKKMLNSIKFLRPN